MRPLRKVVDKQRQPSVWTLSLECGHVAFRSAQYNRGELPGQVPCQACNSLIGSQVRRPIGVFGTVAGYRDGLFDVAWNNRELTHWTLDELREKAEII